MIEHAYVTLKSDEPLI